MPATTHTGGCHCGQVRYEVTLDLGQTMICNCSICTKRGHILSFTSTDQFRLDSGKDMLKDYQFNKHMIHHLFCSECGVGSFATGRTPDGSAMVAINVRCLDNIDLGALNPKHVDGRSF